MIVLVCGSRDWAAVNPLQQEVRIASRLSALPGDPEQITILHGAASRKDRRTGRETSADMLADAAARYRGFSVEQHSADWDTHGKAAGSIRNRQMLDRKPDLVIAFQRNGSRGTQDCVDEARRRGIEVEVHEG